MRHPEASELAREDIVPSVGPRMVVRCDRAGCEHAALLDPRPLFGRRRDWPVVGRSYRFRCQCGSRVARIDYTSNASQAEGPIPAAALALWF